jgi:hypothetical protein
MSNNEAEAYPDSQWRRAYLKLRRSKLIEEKQSNVHILNKKQTKTGMKPDS